jgi:hypothetical protein
LSGTFPAVGEDASSLAPLLAPHARIAALPAGEVYRPTRLQFALAYLRNGDAPPMFGLPSIALADLATFTFSIAACLALGVLLGSAIA